MVEPRVQVAMSLTAAEKQVWDNFKAWAQSQPGKSHRGEVIEAMRERMEKNENS